VLQEFKDFLFRGNIVELAVAFVMGVAFAAVVNSLVENIVMPIVAMIIGEPDFSGLDFTINDAVFRYGAFLTAVIAFLLVAAAIGGLAGFFFADDEVNDYEAARATDPERYASFWRAMLERGIYLPPSRFEALFLSTAHTDEHIEKVATAAQESLTAS
jgi:large conductance mechanosensitive channel protein